MILRLFRGALAAVTVAISIPYTVAIVCNILSGWPQRKDKYSRALNPWKVLSLNYVLCQMIRDKSKCALLYLKWKQFYRNVSPKILIKNISYGRNDCALDVHLSQKSSEKVPVIVFIYGGSWSSGNKNMYGMLAHELVSRTNSLVVCPTYSTYPKGYVDDMVQDVVDCICWVVDNIEQYGGDPNKIVLMGHSAGAQLGALTILELLRDERISVKNSFKFDPTTDTLDELAFADSHYGKMSSLDRWKEGLEDSSGSSESFAVVSENGSMVDNGNSDQGLETSVSEGYVKAEISEEGLEEIAPEQVESIGPVVVDEATGGGDYTLEDKDKTRTETGTRLNRDTPPLLEGPHSDSGGSVGDDEDEADYDSGDNDSIVTVKPKDIDRNTTLSELCKSIKAFIGLAGVYSIADHFQHESMRGIEDVSCMTRAFYGEDHFDRFSPLEVLQRVEGSLSLPQMVLVHGTADYIVPTLASSRFAEVLGKISANVKLRLITDCPHYEVCLDLMDPERKFYGPVMNIILETMNGIS